MIIGIHFLMYSQDADATRAFFRKVLALGSVDAGNGWPIFALPPAELGIHPPEDTPGPPLYLMCDDIERSTRELVAAGAEVTQPLSDERWGRTTMLRIPGDVTVSLYEPQHPTALALSVEQALSRHKKTVAP
jgi:predicted enzyme related to lactoylglutathione lyase